MQVITLNTLLHNLKNRTLTLSRTARSFYDSVYNYCMIKWTFGSNTSPFFYTILMLSENVDYVARLLKKGRGEGRGSECDIGKNKLSIVLPPPPSPLYNLSATTDQSTVLAENQGASPPPKESFSYPHGWVNFWRYLWLPFWTIMNI